MIAAMVVAAVAGPSSWLCARHARRIDARHRARSLASRRVAWELPTRVRAPLVAALARAGVAHAPEVVVRGWLVSALIAMVLAGALDVRLALPALLGAVLAAPVALHVARGRADRAVAVALPATLERLALELQAGCGLVEAVNHVAEGPGPLAGDLRRASRARRLGLPAEEVWRLWAAERTTSGARTTAAALALAETHGGRIAPALERLAGSLRDGLAVRDEARALATQARMSAVVVATAPLAFLAFGVVTDPATLHAFATPLGQACLLLGLGLDLLGALWMRRIVAVPA